MKASMKQKWLQALRSGEYAQGKGWLAYEGKFCCLGVLCEVTGIRRVSAGTRFYYGEMEETTILPTELRAQTGSFYSPSVQLIGLEDREGSSEFLASLNDKGMPFDQIADLIEYFIPEEPDTNPA